MCFRFFSRMPNKQQLVLINALYMGWSIYDWFTDPESEVDFQFTLGVLTHVVAIDHFINFRTNIKSNHFNSVLNAFYLGMLVSKANPFSFWDIGKYLSHLANIRVCSETIEEPVNSPNEEQYLAELGEEEAEPLEEEELEYSIDNEDLDHLPLDGDDEKYSIVEEDDEEEKYPAP